MIWLHSIEELRMFIRLMEDVASDGAKEGKFDVDKLTDDELRELLFKVQTQEGE